VYSWNQNQKLLVVLKSLGKNRKNNKDKCEIVHAKTVIFEKYGFVTLVKLKKKR